MTLFTSDIKKIYFKTALTYFIFSVIAFVFSEVYSLFSHEVYSNFLTYAFLYPLVGGTVLYVLLMFVKGFSKWSYNFYNAGIATITMGSILAGVNEIAGADTLYYLLFYLVGFILIGLSLVVLLVGFIIRRKNK